MTLTVTTRAKGLTAAVDQALIRELKTLGGATSPEMLAAAAVLKRSIKKTLGIKGRGKPSAPGEPPAKQRGALQQSVRSGVVGAGQRVAVTRFTAPLLEFGVDAKIAARAGNPVALAAGGKIITDRRTRRQHAGRHRGQKAYQLTIAPRPFMERALAAVRDQMGDAAVSEIRRRLPGEATP